MPWANGLGVTSVVAVDHDVAQWQWRVSIADVTSDGPFSSLPGVDRWIALVDGAAMELVVDDVPVRLERDGIALAFDGGATSSGRLLDGPVRDLNLMVRRGGGIGSLERVALAAGERWSAPVDSVAVVVVRGEMAVGADRAGPFDAITAPMPTDPLMATEPTELVVASVHPT